MGVDVSTWDPILVHRLESKLESAPKGIWMEKRPPREVAQLQPFIDFLLAEMDKTDDASTVNNSATDCDQSRDQRSNQNHNQSRERRSNHGGHGQNERRTHQNSIQSARSGPLNNNQHHQNNTANNNAPRVKSKIVKPKKCPVCPNAEHSIYACPEFNKLNRERRISKANQKQLCHNCLRTKCSAGRCTLGSCPNGCNEKHNRLLCKKTFAPTVNAAQGDSSQQ